MDFLSSKEGFHNSILNPVLPSVRLMTQTNHVGFWLKYDNLDFPKQKFKNIRPSNSWILYSDWAICPSFNQVLGTVRKISHIIQETVSSSLKCRNPEALFSQINHLIMIITSNYHHYHFHLCNLMHIFKQCLVIPKNQLPIWGRSHPPACAACAAAATACRARCSEDATPQESGDICCGPSNQPVIHSPW